jgi:tetraacyldisaccharide 4'-kinase
MNIIGKILLLPFQGIYSAVSAVRNYLYDTKKLQSVRFEVLTVSVGNLSVGGTGKTPMVEYLIRLFEKEHKIGVLSRGYGRKTKGYVLANWQASAETIGDEPLQFYANHHQKATVAVCEKRVIGIPLLLQDAPDTDIILLDDAFQHRSITPHINLLLTDYSLLFTNDELLPIGRLRESPKGAKRADAVIVTKCPTNLSAESMNTISKNIGEYTAANTPVFFSTIQYAAPAHFFLPEKFLSEDFLSDNSPSKKIVLVTAIANPASIIHFLTQQNYQIIKHFNFADHYHYTPQDIQTFNEYLTDETALFTTEKDKVKLAPLITDKSLPFYFLPIRTVFLPQNDIDFDTWIQKRCF